MQTGICVAGRVNRSRGAVRAGINFVMTAAILYVCLSSGWAYPGVQEDAPGFEVPDGYQDVIPRTAMQIRLYRALEHVLDEEFEQAAVLLEEIIDEDPGQILAWESLGWTYWSLGREEDAVDLWHKLLLLDPGETNAMNLLGMAYAAHGDLDRSAAFYERSLRADPDQERPRFALGRIYRWQGHLEDSIAFLRPLLEADPYRLDIRLELARALLQGWAFEEARPHWEMLHETSPDNPEYRISLARVLLHLDETEEALEAARELLAEDPDNRDALALLADHAEYGDNPADAVPILRRMIRIEEDAAEIHSLRTRLVRLLVRLNRRDPMRHNLDEAIRVALRMAESDPRNVDTRLLLGELHSLDRRFNTAVKHLEFVLENMNPNNMRARRGLFEVYLAKRNYSRSWEQFEYIRRYNPRDPYLNFRRARYESARGNWGQAYKALDRLEEAGRRGAAAVLLYHAISPSDWMSAPSARRFQEQLQALREAGYRFITPSELPAYFKQRTSLPSHLRSDVDRVVMVTFDDALRSSMYHGSRVAREMGIKLTQFVITGFVERGDPFVSTWDELRAWGETGSWQYHSQLYFAEEPAPISGDLYRGQPLANRLWLEDQQRLETLDEFRQRLQREYAHSRTLLEQELGAGEDLLAVAYPLGELGQDARSNIESAITDNLQISSEYYDMGFLQSPFGYAVHGDHPMLYQRHEFDRSVDGEEALAHVERQHPVFLARRTRAEFAALQGRVWKARRILRDLEAAGYPQMPADELRDYILRRSARVFATPPAAERARRGYFDVQWLEPYTGLRGSFFRDNDGRRNIHFDVFGGFNATPRLTLEAGPGWGRLRQSDSNRDEDERSTDLPDTIRIDENRLSLRGTYIFTDRYQVSARGRYRDFSSPAGRSMWGWGLEGYLRPLFALDLLGAFEHDAVPSAVSVVRGVRYDHYSLQGVYNPLVDWLELSAGGHHFDFSDDNYRRHLRLALSWIVVENIGLRIGTRYDGVTSDFETPDYWTPYRLHRYYLEAGLRRNFYRYQYDLAVRGGVGREGVRPETEAAFAELSDRARRLRFDPGEAPSSDWEPVAGVSASGRLRFMPHWELYGTGSFNRNPQYREFNLEAGVSYSF